MAEAVRFFRVVASEAGLRVDRFLAEKLTELTRIRIGNLIAAGACTVNGEEARAGQHLAAGDSIQLRIDENLPGAMSPDPIPVEILFEDEHLLVVVKPAGMLVHPTRSVKRGTLANALTHHLNDASRQSQGPQPLSQVGSLLTAISATRPIIRPGIVHRLDRATSGLMVIAKNQRALSLLSRHFSRRLVEKRYLALVRGLVEPDSGSIEAPIGRESAAVPHWRVSESGRSAQTLFSVIERRSNTTLLELRPLTGRTNQLRIHMAHLGHPIVGDQSWDENASMARKSSDAADVKSSDDADMASNLASPARLMLHASMLGFHHPVGGEWMTFSSPAPAAFGMGEGPQ